MQSSVYNPYFTPMQYSPALWLDASDASTLVMDGARTFNGSSQAFTKAHNSTHPDASGDFWISAFVYLNATDASYRSAITKADSTTLADWIVSKNNVNQMYFTVDYDSTDTPAVGVTVTSTVTMSATTWCHVFVYYDYSSGVIGISVNGESFVTATKARVLGVNSKTLNVGANANGGFNFWNGKLDSVAFGKPTSGWLASNATALRDYLYNSGSGRRSSDFISSAYYTGGNPSGAVSWWDMDARSGNETDRIGSNNLTDNGGVGYAAGVASGLVQYTGDPVKQWSDKSGNSRHVTAASDAYRPTYITGVKNGLPGIRFDKVNDFLACASGIGVGGLAGYTVFGVLSYAASSNQLALSSANGVVKLQSNVLLEYASCALTDYGQYTATIAVHIVTQVYDGSQTGNANRLKAYTDGTQQSLTFTGTIGATLAASTSFTLGIADNDKVTAPFGGDWLELIVVPSVLSTADVAKFHRYLGNKWGVAVA